MPKLPHNSDAIIYNDYSTGSSRRAIKSVLLGLWWEEKKAVNVIQSGLTTANSTEVMVTKREGYLPPQQWQQLTLDEALSGEYWTIQETDLIIKDNPLDAPLTFTSIQNANAHFTAAKYPTHTVMSVDEKIFPGGKTSHFEIGCK